jgi:hypothetical protein
MRNFVLFLSGSLILSGCALFPSAPNQNQPKTTENRAPELIVRLADSNLGRVAKVNPKFAVLTFPFGSLPGPGQSLNVYRDGKKVAELKVTGPQHDINTVADIVSGEVQLNDEVRAD